MKTLFIVLALLFTSFQSVAYAECAANISSLRDLFNDPSFPLSWTETSMTDGNPLVMTINEKNGALDLQFVKTNVGPWASGTADICANNGEITASISKDQIQLGDAAPFILKLSMSAGASFSLQLTDPSHLVISTTGWHSEFSPTNTK